MAHVGYNVIHGISSSIQILKCSLICCPRYKRLQVDTYIPVIFRRQKVRDQEGDMLNVLQYQENHVCRSYFVDYKIWLDFFFDDLKQKFNHQLSTIMLYNLYNMIER